MTAASGTTLLLIRHGETQWNLDNRVQGHLDVPLTEKGRVQARLLASWLASEPLAAVYSSDLCRASETAEIIAGDRAALFLEPRLREAAFGEFQGLTTPEIKDRFPEAYAAWRHDAVRNRPPGGETLEDLGDRCLAALRDMVERHPGETVAVVAHGGPIRVMVCGVLGLGLEVYPKLRVENTSLSRLLFTSRGSVLAGFNETSHLRDSEAILEHSGWEEK
jgi:broad specificity phosphatase PhoE